MKILPLYVAIAESLGYTIEDDIFYYHDGEELQPAKFTALDVERTMIIPTYDRIKAGFGDKFHPFHPLCESVIEGQSPTVKFLRLTMIRALKQYGITLIDNFLTVACGKRKPRSVEFANLKASITEGIKDPKFDETLLKSWHKIKASVIEDPKLVRVHLGSNREISGTKYARVCSYTHRFSDECEDKTQYFLDIKLNRKADKAILVRLAQAVFGMMPSQTGSNDERPYFGSMMRGWREFVTGYNRITHSMQEVKKFDKLNDEWCNEIDDLEKFENVIQTLSLNAGAGAKKVEKQPVTQAFAQPERASDIEKPAANGMVSLSELANRSKNVPGTNLFGQREPLMSAAERRARESAPQHTGMFNTQQNTSMFNTPQNQTGSMFNTQQSTSMFSTQQTTSMFSSAPQQNSTPSMFNTGGNSIF